jgi:hypothetical protein
MSDETTMAAPRGSDSGVRAESGYGISEPARALNPGAGRALRTIRNDVP